MNLLPFYASAILVQVPVRIIVSDCSVEGDSGDKGQEMGCPPPPPPPAAPGWSKNPAWSVRCQSASCQAGPAPNILPIMNSSKSNESNN